MFQALHYLKESASQTAGPYVHIGLVPAAAGFDTYKTEASPAFEPVVGCAWH